MRPTPPAPAPHGPKFAQFHAVFVEILAKSYIDTPYEDCSPLSTTWTSPTDNTRTLAIIVVDPV